jgi:hypothetical protein
MGYKDHRRTELLVQLGQFDARAGTQGGIQVRQRLIELEQRRLLHDGARDRRALALAAGELAGSAPQQLGDFQTLCRRFDPALNLSAGTRALRARRRGSRGPSCAGEGILLKHHRDVARTRRQVIDPPSLDHDLAIIQ